MRPPHRRSPHRRLVLVAALLLAPAAAQAQVKLDCSDPGNLPQQLMNHCADLEWQQADGRLNALWPDAVQAAASMGFEDKLREAQRLWIPYRDAACTAEAALMAGGSMEPLLFATCRGRLTETRIGELMTIVENW